MLETILIVCIGLIGGIAVGIQTPVVGSMSDRIGGVAGSLVIHLSGAIASLVILVFRGGENISEWRSLSWYMLASGVFGLVLFMSLSQTVPKLGATSAITLIVVGQLFAGMVIDHFGLFDVASRSIDLNRIAASALLLAGAYLMVR